MIINPVVQMAGVGVLSLIVACLLIPAEFMAKVKTGLVAGCITVSVNTAGEFISVWAAPAPPPPAHS